MLNNNLLTLGLPAITTPPLPQAVDAFTSLTITADPTAKTLTLNFAPKISSLMGVQLLATPGISAGISFVKSEFRILTQMNQNHTTGFAAGPVYIARFGAIPAAGTKIFVKMFQVVYASGQAGIPIQASCISTVV
ncbi:unnamed protein product [marine sediment metagenome]|uniref:Cohesin domain-containing protein n=1 Tax=marine sediment metagenome TaxID=412755 RepID=X1U082_9ZZZZ